jgi:hypothetical protein
VVPIAFSEIHHLELLERMEQLEPAASGTALPLHRKSYASVAGYRE